MNLILTEKRDAARMIASALNVPTADKGGFFESGGFIVTWAQGHLVETCPPEYYDESYQKWNLDHLPIIPTELATRPMPAHKAKIGLIKKLINRSDTVINACDCGQEGELIARLIFKHCGFDKPHKRLWFNSLLKAEVKRSISNLKESSETEHLYLCASLRSFIDWTFGYNLTRAFSLKLADGFVVNTGRVTTPTLTAIVERQLEIDHFKPEKYNVLVFTKDGFKYTSEHLPDNINASEDFSTFTVSKSEKKPAVKSPPKLFSLNTLQKEANRIYSFKADKTLNIAQSLYEKGLITYPRTDSEFLPEDFTLSEMKSVFDLHRMPFTADTADKRIFNTQKVTDHHAIIPTTQNPLSVSKDEQAIYDLILRRLFASFSRPCLLVSFAIEGQANHIHFKSSRSIITDPGFKTIYNFQSSDSKTAESPDEPELKDPDAISIPSINDRFDICPDIDQRTTKPPACYTDATLISFMENAGRVIDEKLSSGIGTVATRAQIIKKLETQKFIAYHGKQIKATDKAIRIIQAIPFDYIKKPFLTVELESLVDRLTSGSMSFKDCQQMANSKLKSLFSEINQLTAVEKITSDRTRPIDLKCPICNAPLKAGKFSVYCADKGHRFSLPYMICGKKLSAADHKALTAGQPTRLIKKMTGKSGRMFNARLSLNPETFKIDFQFDKK